MYEASFMLFAAQVRFLNYYPRELRLIWVSKVCCSSFGRGELAEGSSCLMGWQEQLLVLQHPEQSAFSSAWVPRMGIEAVPVAAGRICRRARAVIPRRPSWGQTLNLLQSEDLALPFHSLKGCC